MAKRLTLPTSIMRKCNRLTLSRMEAEYIVGGRDKLFTLIGQGAIRAEKRDRSGRHNARWYINMFDVLSFATAR